MTIKLDAHESARYVSYDNMIRHIYEQFNVLFLYFAYCYPKLSPSDQRMMDTLCDPDFIELLKLRALTSDKFLFNKMKEIVQVNNAKDYKEFIKEVLLASDPQKVDEMVEGIVYSNPTILTYSNLVRSLREQYRKEKATFVELVSAAEKLEIAEFVETLQSLIDGGEERRALEANLVEVDRKIAAQREHIRVEHIRQQSELDSWFDRFSLLASQKKLHPHSSEFSSFSCALLSTFGSLLCRVVDHGEEG
jgi:hypothetical protein